MPKVDERARVPALDDAARRQLACALDRPGVVAGFLIGSQAAGRAGPLSDVDLAAWLAPTLSAEARFALRLDLLRAAAEALGTDEVDLVVLNDAGPLLRHRAMTTREFLVERDHAQRVRYETRAVLEYLDAAPLRATLATGLRRRIDEGRFGRR